MHVLVRRDGTEVDTDRAMRHRLVCVRVYSLQLWLSLAAVCASYHLPYFMFLGFIPHGLNRHSASRAS